MEVEVGTVWSVGRNLAAGKAELRHLPAFDTSIWGFGELLDDA